MCLDGMPLGVYFVIIGDMTLMDRSSAVIDMMSLLLFRTGIERTPYLGNCGVGRHNFGVELTSIYSSSAPSFTQLESSLGHYAIDLRFPLREL